MIISTYSRPNNRLPRSRGIINRNEINREIAEIFNHSNV